MHLLHVKGEFISTVGLCPWANHREFGLRVTHLTLNEMSAEVR